jgi:hypothetical protein
LKEGEIEEVVEAESNGGGKSGGRSRRRMAKSKRVY